MYNLDRVEEVIIGKRTHRRCGKTVANCFIIAGVIELTKTPKIIIVQHNMYTAEFFLKELVKVFVFLNIKYEIVNKRMLTIQERFDCQKNTIHDQYRI